MASYCNHSFSLLTAYQMMKHRLLCQHEFVLGHLKAFQILFPAFLLLPELIGEKGMWLALPLSEIATFAVVVAYVVVGRRNR